jgi:hemoglobin/transferrin/lactoferrin receptor protein
MPQTYATSGGSATKLFNLWVVDVTGLALKLHEFCVRQTLFVQFISQVLPYVRTASFVLGVGITVRGFAQAPAPTEDTLDLREVVISAARWKQTAEHIPSQVAVVLPKLIAQFQPQTAADLLSLTGKVFIQKSQQGGGSPMIRGFATNRLIYSVDGVRMNTAIFRAGNIQNVINLDPYAMDRTEVVFGPASVMYGSDAIGGVMSFTTLQPVVGTKGVHGSAQARYSSANSEQTGHIDLQYGGPKWAGITSLSRWDFDHLRQGSRGPRDYIKARYVDVTPNGDVVRIQSDSLLQIPTGYTQQNLMQKFVFVPAAGWELQYGLHYSATSDYGRYDRHNRVRNGLPRYAEWNYGPQRWTMHNMSLRREAKKRFADLWTLRVAAQRFEESRIDRALNATDRMTQSERVGAYSVNWDATKEWNATHTFFYGVEGVWNSVNSDGVVEDVLSGLQSVTHSRYPQSTWYSVGIYATEAWAVTPKTTITSGLRANAVGLDADFSQNLDFFPLPFGTAQVRDAAVTGSFGATYRPTADWIIKANLGTAFRAPNVDDLGKIFDSSPGMVVVPNDNLKSEYAYNVDVDVAKLFGTWFKVDVAAYATLLENALVRRPFVLDGHDSIMYGGEMSRVEAVQNAAIARVVGAYFGMEARLSKTWSTKFSYNVQRGVEELDNGDLSPSRHAAPAFGLARLTYQKGKFRVDLTSQVQAARSNDELAWEERAKTEMYALDSEGNAYSPAWYTLNARASVELKQGVILNLGLENITDQRYRPYSSGISGAGRNAVVAVAARF